MAKDPSYRLHRASGLLGFWASGLLGFWASGLLGFWASGRAVVTINGRDHYLGLHGTKESKAAYKKLLSEWKSTSRSTTFGLSKNGITVAMLAADYLDHCQSHYPARSLQGSTSTK